MHDGPFPPPPTGRRRYIPVGCALVGVLVGGPAFALLFLHFRDSFGPNASPGHVWIAAGIGVFWGFVTGLLVGRRVARLWK
jgi:hypothetical protein